jgi:hypothetical protein
MSTINEEVPNGNGSIAAPYRRTDGSETVKWSLVVSVDFAQKFHKFKSRLPLGMTKSEWVTAALEKAMQEHKG